MARLKNVMIGSTKDTNNWMKKKKAWSLKKCRKQPSRQNELFIRSERNSVLSTHAWCLSGILYVWMEAVLSKRRNQCSFCSYIRYVHANTLNGGLLLEVFRSITELRGWHSAVTVEFYFIYIFFCMRIRFFECHRRY